MNEITSVGMRGIEPPRDHVAATPANAQAMPSSAQALKALGGRLDDEQRADEADADRASSAASRPPRAKKITAIAVMISGETRLIAESSASGMWISAVVNRTIAMPSSAVRREHDAAETAAQSAETCPKPTTKAPTNSGRDQAAHGDDFAERIALRGQLQHHVVDGERRHRARKCEHAAAIGAR